MGFIRDFYTGVAGYGSALSMTRKYQLWHFFIVPGILNLFLFIALFYLAWVYSGDIAASLIQKIELYNVKVTYPGLLRYFVRIALYICMFFIYLKTYKYVVLILLSPLLSYIAERTQEIATGTIMPFSMKIYIANIFRGIKMTIRNLFREVPLSILLFLFTLLPGIGILASLLLMYTESYYWGFAMLDYRNEFYNKSSAQSIAHIHKHKGLAVSNGLVFLLLLAIPVLGLLLAPGLSVMAAGLAANKVDGVHPSASHS